MSLPCITGIDIAELTKSEPKWLFVAEGFEERSLTFAGSLPVDVKFQKIVIFKNLPERKSRLDELHKCLIKKCDTEKDIDIVNFERDDPTSCESNIEKLIVELSMSGAHLYIDISVFSRLLIMMTVVSLREFPGKVTYIYTEPKEYSPSKDEFEKFVDMGKAELGAFTSAGLQGVLRTVGLSSSVMAGEPCVVIAFTSFNPHLIGGLLRSISPARFVLIGSVPPRLGWRERAAQTIHSQIIDEYPRDNELSDSGILIRSSSTLDYRETLDILSKLYKEFCFTHRIVVAPTGSKLQALGAGLFRSICKDVHIEYPMPAKYFSDKYSSKEIEKIHQIVFTSYSENLTSIEKEFGLDGTWR